jgi:hypothetical protein
MKLSDDKKAAIFRKLASGTLYDVGLEFGFDKHYKDSTGIRNRVYAIYRDVANNHDKYAVSQETIDLVVEAVSNRKVATRTEPTLREKHEAIAEKDIKSITVSGRDTAGRLILNKLAYLEAHPKALAQESIVNLGKIFGILFDKGQIISGQATEHIALMGRIDSNMTPDQAIEAVLRSREAMQAEKHG